MVEATILEMGGGVSITRGVDAGIPEDVAMVSDGLEEDGGIRVVGGVEVSITSGGGRGSQR